MFLLSLLAAASWLLVAARPAEACSCNVPFNPCTALQQSTVAFVGTVASIREVGPHQFATTITVEEALVGKPGKTAVILGTWDGASCDDQFREGDRMLIYAGGEAPDRLRATCSRSMPVKRAAEDLAYLRKSKGKRTGVVTGTAMRTSGDGWTPATPHADALVRARGTAYSTRTDAAGQYRLELPPGDHALQLELPPDVILATTPAEPIAHVSTVGSCTQVYFHEVWNGRIRGRVLDHRGQPAAGVTVEAFDQREWRAATTDAAGRYQLERVSAGKHLVGVGLQRDGLRPVVRPIAPTYYPGVGDEKAARPVEVARAGLVENIDLTLPAPRPVYAVSLRLTQAGAPLGKRVQVHALRSRDELADTTPGPGGKIEIPWLGGAFAWDVCVPEAYKVAPSCVTVRHPAADHAVELAIDLPPPGKPVDY